MFGRDDPGAVGAVAGAVQGIIGVFGEVPTAVVVDIAVLVVVEAGFALRFGLVGPDVRSEQLVPVVHAGVDHGDDDPAALAGQPAMVGSGRLEMPRMRADRLLGGKLLGPSGDLERGVLEGRGHGRVTVQPGDCLLANGGVLEQIHAGEGHALVAQRSELQGADRRHRQTGAETGE